MTEMDSMPNANESSIRIIPFENVHQNACREIFSRGLSNQGSTALIRALQKWFVGSKIDTEKGDMYDIGKFFMTGGKGTGGGNSSGGGHAVTGLMFFVAVDAAAPDPAAPVGCVGVTTCSYDATAEENVRDIYSPAAGTSTITSNATSAADGAKPAPAPARPARSSPHAHSVCELCRMSVDGKYAGQGVGSQLVSAVIAYAREQGMHTVVLSTLEDMQPAQRLYEKMGFAQFRTTPIDIRKVPLDRAALKKEVEQEQQQQQQQTGKGTQEEEGGEVGVTHLNVVHYIQRV